MKIWSRKMLLEHVKEKTLLLASQGVAKALKSWIHDDDHATATW